MFEMIASIAGPLIGSMMQSDSAEDAQQAQSESSAAAIGEQKRQYDQSRKDLAPWRDTGSAASYRLAELLGLDTTSGGAAIGPGGPIPKGAQDLTAWAAARGYDLPTGRDWNSAEEGNLYRAGYQQYLQDFAATNPATRGADFGSLNKKFSLADFWDDPVTKASYQFGLDEGTKALENMAGARGNRNSGAQLKALSRFATDYTGQQAGQSYNRFYGDQDRTFNRLSGVAGTGQTAATNTAQMGQNTGNTISGLISAQGNARGAASIAGGNAMGGALNTVGNYFSQQNTLDKLLGRGGNTSYSDFTSEFGF